MEYSIKKQFVVLGTVFFLYWNRNAEEKLQLCFFNGAWDCLQMCLSSTLKSSFWMSDFTITAGSSLYTSVFVCTWSFDEASCGLLGLVLLLVVHSGSILQKKPTAFKNKMGYVPVVALLLRFIQFHIISSWVNGHSEVMAMLVGNILFQYRRAVKCQKLLVLLSQFPRPRMSATCQASHMRWVL